MKDWGRSDNDQRHRLVVSASVNSPMTRGTTLKDGTEIAVSRTRRRRVAAALAWRQTSSIKAGR